MPAQSKLVKPTKSPVPAPVVASSSQSVAEVPVVEKKTKKSKVVSAAAAVEEVPVKGPEVVASSSTSAPVVPLDAETSDVVADSADSHLVELSTKFYTKLAESHQIISSLTTPGCSNPNRLKVQVDQKIPN
jgi:hypothetical protein